MDLLRAAAGRHLTVDEIHHSLRDAGVTLSIGTVYRVVATLEEAGIVRRVEVSRHHQPVVYELADRDCHYHMVCVDTGQIIEFQDDRLLAVAQEIAERRGYSVETHSVILHVRKRNGGRE